MSPARITNNQMSQIFLSDLNDVQSRLARIQQQLSTGSKINTPSDDVTGTAQVLGFDRQLADIASFQRSIAASAGFLSTSESALSSTTTALQRVRELLVQAGNSTVDQNGANAIATEIAQLKETIRSQANARHGDIYVFSGTETPTMPYPAPANTYMSSGIQLMRRYDDTGAAQALGLPGPIVFGTTTGGTPAQLSLFDLLDRAVTDLTSGAPAARTEASTTVLAALDTHLGNIMQQRAALGAQINDMEARATRMSDLEGRLSEARSQIADVDAAKAMIEFQNTNVMYQSALAAGSRMMQTSILDFL